MTLSLELFSSALSGNRFFSSDYQADGFRGQKSRIKVGLRADTRFGSQPSHPPQAVPVVVHCTSV